MTYWWSLQVVGCSRGIGHAVDVVCELGGIVGMLMLMLMLMCAILDTLIGKKKR